MRTAGSTVTPYALAALLLAILIGGTGAEEAKSGASAIGTRDGVQARHSPPRRDRAGEHILMSPATGNPALRRPSGFRALSPPTRNAIGVTVPRNEAVGRSGGEVRAFTSMYGAGAGATGQGTPAGIARVTIPFGNGTRGRPTPGVASTAAPLRRSSIGGAGIVRPGAGLSRLGGPAKAIAGINGTTIRPKH